MILFHPFILQEREKYMAKKIQGITVEIGGDSTGLQNSLKKANSVIQSTNKELKEVNNLLKYDPKNTELLAQKQKLLSTQIQNVNQKLKDLKNQDAQMQKSLKSGEISEAQYNKFRREIIATEGQLKSYQNQLKNVNTQQKGLNMDKITSSFNSLGKSVGDIGLKLAKFSTATLVAGFTAVSAALVSVVKDSVKAKAELEQNLGGVETLFGDSAQTVIENAKNAYKTAGISANEYMQTVTSFSASLLQSLDGDTEIAAKKADMALQDMADNANKFGTDMEAIQNAYQGFAKQNYTINLMSA